MSEHVRVAGKINITPSLQIVAPLAPVWYARRPSRGRGAEKRGCRSSLMILLHFADVAGLEEGGTRDR